MKEERTFPFQACMEISKFYKVKGQIMTKIIFFAFCTLALVYSSIVVCKQKTALNIGDKAPDFTLVDQQGVSHSLSDMRGKKIALCFYPKDDTPGCSRQACSIQNGLEQLQDNGITVWGL